MTIFQGKHADLLDQLTTDGRISEQRKAHDILRGRVGSYFQKEVLWRTEDPEGGESLIRHQDISFNLLRFVVGKLAQVYATAPVRRFEDPSDQLVFDAATSDGALDLAMREVNRLALACGVCFAVPYIRVVDGGLYRIGVRVLPPHLVAVDWLSETEVSSALYATDAGRHVLMDTRGWSLWETATGRMVASAAHECGSIPIVVYRTTYPSIDDYWSLGDRQDLIDATVMQCVWRSYINRIAWYQSFIQLCKDPGDFPTPTAGKQGDVYSGPGRILVGRYSTVSLQADLSRYQALVSENARLIARTYGIPVEDLTAANYRSGSEVAARSHDLTIARTEQCGWFLPSDKRLMSLVVAMVAPRDGGIHGVSGATIAYRDPSLMATEGGMIDLSAKKIKIGLESPVDAYMRLHPEVMTRGEALTALETIRGENEELDGSAVESLTAGSEPPASQDPDPISSQEGTNGVEK